MVTHYSERVNTGPDRVLHLGAVTAIDAVVVTVSTVLS